MGKLSEGEGTTRENDVLDDAGAILMFRHQMQQQEQQADRDAVEGSFTPQQAIESLVPVLLIFVAIIIMLITGHRMRRKLQQAQEEDAASPRKRRNRWHGFSLLEVLLVMLILGMLGAIAVPRLMDNSSVELHLAAEQVAEGLRQTRHMAMTRSLYDGQSGTNALRDRRYYFSPCGDGQGCFRFRHHGGVEHHVAGYHGYGQPLAYFLDKPDSPVVFVQESGVSVTDGVRFDSQGRPWTGKGFNNMLHNQRYYTSLRYQLRHTRSDERLFIHVNAFTGHVEISAQVMEG
ncbi:hypothetical protein Selin_0718 [Desulfurispirillum indicum S5]|uniref:Prepilin-type N-terminal cleavage/methylation domain-containing protein n=1 Tax=Desulfurispirillum indicum (strain ATCC BAA-1389 / DSM 22839 / S5) TaxID=653733 RepID=E6W1T0_DESIS|nr:type II secretion system protein [Desulfurispirillum indicum]ADU65462.1 hypothetical protein Selin_0718 [Desulfurispirillum indicum S5]